MWVGFDNGGVMDSSLIAAAAGLMASGVTGAFALILRRMDLRKFNAEIARVKADTHKVEAETDDLVSARLIRELDRLSLVNEQQGLVIEQQRAEIDTLRRKILEYGVREMSHATENEALRREIENLRTPTSATGEVLRQAFPVEIPHLPSEFDHARPTDEAE